MSYNHELTLIGEGGYTEDDIGNQIPVDPTETTILCRLQSVGRSEFYSAATSGLRPEKVFVIHSYEYNEEKKIRFEDRVFRVVRTYAIGFEEMELTCERVAGDG